MAPLAALGDVGNNPAWHAAAVETDALKAAGYVEVRIGKGSHRQFRHPTTDHESWDPANPSYSLV
jgi:hypothetical protein